MALLFEEADKYTDWNEFEGSYSNYDKEKHHAITLNNFATIYPALFPYPTHHANYTIKEALIVAKTLVDVFVTSNTEHAIVIEHKDMNHSFMYSRSGIITSEILLIKID